MIVCIDRLFSMFYMITLQGSYNVVVFISPALKVKKVSRK